jgi:SSS family solute:Na+ symporter
MFWVPMTIVFLYIVSLFVISWIARRYSRGGMINYLLAGRGLPFWVVAPLLSGLAIGGASTIGVAESAYTLGISAGWYNAAWAAGALLVGLLAARRYRQMEVATLPELFERRYNISGRVVGVIGQLILHIVIISLQYVAGGAILSSLLPDVFSFQSGMFVTALVFLGITLIGGFWAAGLTNIINVIFIYAGVLLGAVLALDKGGGAKKLISNLPANHHGFDLGAIGTGIIIAWFIVMCTMTFSVQSVVQISFAAKDTRSAKKGFILAGLVILPVGFISAFIGIAAAALHPGILPTEALPQTVLGLNPIVGGIVLAGLWAADVSTASALLIGCTTLVLNDLVKRFLAPGLKPRGERIVARLSIVILSALTYFLAVSVSGILETLLIGLTLTTAYTLVTLMTLFWPGVCRRAHATWTPLAAMAALALWLTVPKIPEAFRAIHLSHPIYLCWIVSLVTFFLIAAVDKRPIKHETAAPRVPPGERSASVRKLDKKARDVN